MSDTLLRALQVQEENIRTVAGLSHDGKQWKAIATPGGHVRFLSKGCDEDEWAYDPTLDCVLPATPGIMAIGGTTIPHLLACGFAGGHYARAYERKNGTWQEISPPGGIGYPGSATLRMLGNELHVEELSWQWRQKGNMWILCVGDTSGHFLLSPSAWYQFWFSRWRATKV